MSMLVNTPKTVLLAFILFSLGGLAASTIADREVVTILTGRFVAKIPGPRLTSFGSNHDSYVFAVDSPTGSTFITLSYTFFLYEPQIHDRFLDYSRRYKIAAVRHPRCDRTLDALSETAIFDHDGAFVGIEYAVTYAEGAQAVHIPSKVTLPCYVLSAEDVIALLSRG
jgi:hypothetical protein